LTRTRRISLTLVAIGAWLHVRPHGALAQGTPAGSAAQNEPIRITAPPLIVTAQKEPADSTKLPVSVTAVSGAMLDAAGDTAVSEAAIYSPNTFFSEFSARKLSNARIRGVGSSPNNPGVTTYIDGVAQLNANSSSIEFLDVGQVEFVRGPQSALFGRNTLGGLISIVSARPASDKWTGNVRVPFGSFDEFGFRAVASGPISDSFAVSVGFGRQQRNGFTVNDITGNDLDSREANFGKAQLLWTPSPTWETRLILNGEWADDGDYALYDLGSLRANPFHAARDFEGKTERDILGATLNVLRRGNRFTLTSTTGVLHWDTQDATDLDYTPLPLITRDNGEKATQFSEEIRLASSTPVRLSGRALQWQTGAVLFTQSYDQNAVNHFSPFFLSQDLPFAVDSHSNSALDDVGFGLYGQGVIAATDKLDFTAGARFDYEQKDANILTTSDPVISAPALVDEDRSFSNVSPQFGVTYRLRPDRTLYASIGRGFKAGGFNPTSPPGSESYDEEGTWNIEGGTKASFAGGKGTATATAFWTDWDDLQLNLPTDVPAQFYIANVGAAQTAGLELALTAQPHANLGVFGSFGYAHARFSDGSVSSGLDVSGNTLPNTPDYTASLGAQFTRAISTSYTMYGRGEAAFFGEFQYDDLNTESQEAYALVDFSAGIERKGFLVELWVKNAFDARYFPIAFAYGQLAQSGFIGETGRPRTWGVRAGYSF